MKRIFTAIAILFLVNRVGAQCIDVKSVYQLRDSSIDAIQEKFSSLGWDYNGEKSDSGLHTIRYSYRQNPGDLSRATCWFRIQYFSSSEGRTLLFLTVDFMGQKDYQETLAAVKRLGFVLEDTQSLDSEISRTYANPANKLAGKINITEFVTKDVYSPKAYSFSVWTKYGTVLLSTVFNK